MRAFIVFSCLALAAAAPQYNYQQPPGKYIHPSAKCLTHSIAFGQSHWTIKIINNNISLKSFIIAPVQSYAAPVQSYAAPAPVYAQPAPQYSAPGKYLHPPQKCLNIF